ncbi:MAG: ComEA family DNA-binding protein [Oscillospiraceae bacterium]|nr:ComEA family DNA-binding protein [Oscillospiraceae bacterium]
MKKIPLDKVFSAVLQMLVVIGVIGVVAVNIFPSVDEAVVLEDGLYGIGSSSSSSSSESRYSDRNQPAENASAESTVVPSNTKININTASLEQLKTLSGIGDVKAQAIIDYREANGGFASIEELVNVKGIGGKTLDNLRDCITV